MKQSVKYSVNRPSFSALLVEGVSKRKEPRFEHARTNLACSPRTLIFTKKKTRNYCGQTTIKTYVNN